MPVIIPKKLVQKDNLVIVPRKEYEGYLKYKKLGKSVRTYKPTKAELRMIKRAKEDFKKSNYMTLEQLKEKLNLN